MSLEKLTSEEREALIKKLGLSWEIIRQYLSKIAFRRQMQLEQRGNFDEKYPEDPITAFIVSGGQFFDKDLVIARKRELIGFHPKALLRGGNGQIFISRVATRRYVVGADVASGRQVSTEDTDYNAAVVLDLETGEEMAALHLRSRPEEFAWDLAELGEYYNFAPIAVERTGDGGTTILTLANECRYPAVLKYKEWLKRDRTRFIEMEGYPTTPRTRPIFLNFLNRMLSSHPELVWDGKFLDECLTFVRSPKGKIEAATGAHDDRISCRWVAHAARMVLLGYFDELGAKTEKYIPASQITQEELVSVA